MPDLLERYLDDFGRQLQDAATRPQRRARRRALLRTAPLLACALIALVVVLVSGGSSTKPVNAVAAARQAITPSADEIVYLRVTNRVGHTRGVALTRQAAQQHTTEQWTAADPSRWRYVQTIPRDRRFGTVVSEGRRVVGRQEFTYADGKQSTYDVNLSRVVVTEGFAPDGPASMPLGIFGDDPQRTLPELLRTGQIHDLGIVAAHGRKVRRLRRIYDDHGRLRRTFTYDVDPETFAPVAGEWRISSLKKGASGMDIAETFTVDRYKRIPLTPATAGLLTIHPPAGTRVIRYAVKPSGRGRTRIAMCVTRPAGSLACRRATTH